MDLIHDPSIFRQFHLAILKSTLPAPASVHFISELHIPCLMITLQAASMTLDPVGIFFLRTGRIIHLMQVVCETGDGPGDNFLFPVGCAEKILSLPRNGNSHHDATKFLS
jgi:hypothetical protein